jgi:hypothetical protein
MNYGGDVIIFRYFNACVHQTSKFPKMTTKIFPQVNLTGTDKFYFNYLQKYKPNLKDF